MKSDQILAFPVFIKQEEGKYKVYIPDTNEEETTDTFAYALYRARQFLESAFVMKEIDIASIPDDLCSVERAKELVSRNGKTEYLDAPVYYVDLDLKRTDLHDLGEVTVKLPQLLINMADPININLSAAVKETLEKEITRIKMLGRADRMLWQTAEILTEGAKFYGEVKRVIRDDKTKNDSVIVRTSLYNLEKIPLSLIKDFNKTPVVMNEYGTFHITNQEGLLSVAGHTGLKDRHIDVYLEYNPLVPLEDQKTFEGLKKFNEIKYDLDELLRNRIADLILNLDVAKVLIPEYMDKNSKVQRAFARNILFEYFQLWFIDISSDMNIHLDYNFRNEIGEMSVNADGNIDDNHFSISLARAAVYTSEEEEEEDEDPNGNMRA